MIKLMLNTHKFNNYAFFCPVSRLHLTVSNPVGFANEVTAAILRALKAKTILDVDGVIDIETGAVKETEAANVPLVQKPSSTPEPAKPQATPELTNPEPEEKSHNEDNGDAEQENPDETETVEKAVESAAETGEKPKKGGRKAKAE